jgi:hypothetical protein
MKTKLKPYGFLIDPAHVVALQALKERDGVPHGVSIRRALDHYLREKGVLKTPRSSKKARG